MREIKSKFIKIKNSIQVRHWITMITVLIVVVIVLGFYIYQKEKEYKIQAENEYNMAFYELVDYVQNVETYLAKSTISTSSVHGAEVLTHVWREANLAQAYLAMLPIGSEELSNTSKFLNQVSDYSYTLSRKNIYNNELTQDDLTNLENMHKYSIELENTLNQLEMDMQEGRINWKGLIAKGSSANLTAEVSNLSKDSFSNLEENFHEYAGLIYDGAFSDHLTSVNKKGLTGENIDEKKAEDLIREFVGLSKIKEIEMKGLSENTNMPCYDFDVKINDEKNNYINISISQKGGHIVYMSYNRQVEVESISEDRANEIGIEFLNNHGFNNMQETYFLKQEGILTINYAYVQNSNSGKVVMYPDLIKVKIALDNGEIMGIETTGYLNSHYDREIKNINITKDEAKKKLNNNLQIKSEGLAVIPTEFQTEILCWEFKGLVENSEFLVYINVENGNEEDILVIKNTPNGTLTM